MMQCMILYNWPKSTRNAGPTLLCLNAGAALELMAIIAMTDSFDFLSSQPLLSALKAL